MAYVLGFIYADGAIEDCRESSRTCYLSLANNDIVILKDIMSIMSTTHKIQKREPRKIQLRGKEYWCKASYSVRIGNKAIYNDLVNLGLCPRKSLIIKLPNIADKYFGYFLKGYFDGDGCINIEKNNKNRLNVIFTSGSKEFLEKIAERVVLLYPTIKSSLSFGSGAYRLRYNWRNANIVAELIYRNTLQTPYIKYKYNKYIQYLNTK